MQRGVKEDTLFGVFAPVDETGRKEDVEDGRGEAVSCAARGERVGVLHLRVLLG